LILVLVFFKSLFCRSYIVADIEKRITRLYSSMPIRRSDQNTKMLHAPTVVKNA